MLKKSFRNLLLSAVVLGTLGAARGGEAFSDRLTARPDAAFYWQNASVCGKDFHLALQKEKWLPLKGVAEEKFVQDAAFMYAPLPIIVTNKGALRTGIIREVELLDGSGKNMAPALKSFFVPEEKSTVFLHEKNLNDGKKETFAVVSGDHRNNKSRFRSVKGTLGFSKGTQAVTAVRIHHGSGASCQLQKFAFFDGSGKKIAFKNARATRGVFSAALTRPVLPQDLKITFQTAPYRISIKDFTPELSRTLQKVPFVIPDFVRLNENNFIGLSEENIDRRSFERFTGKYKNTFMGFGIAEFDANYGQSRRPGNPNFKNLEGFAPRKDNNREEAVRYMHNLWNFQSNILGDNVYSMSGGVMGSPYMAEWGSRNLILEYSCRLDRSARILSMFARSAARQYSVPWGFYMAYFAATGSPSSVRRRLDFGQPPSHGLRAMMMNYYMGENYQWFESQPWGMVVKEKNGTHALTPNGKAIKEFYDWISKDEGKRGSCYTPVLLLLDYHHGQTGRPDWKVWYHLPMQDGDYMAKHIFDTISPLHPKARFTEPAHCINLANSSIGDLFDVFFANAPSGTVTFDELGKYAVVILADDIRFTPELTENLKKYVSAGGTLVVNSGHLKGFEKESAFLGFHFLKKFVWENNMRLAAVRCTSAKVVKRSGKGDPLVCLNRYGKGHVLFTTALFMLEKNKKVRSRLIGELLEKIQSEVLPFKVSGDVHFLVNQMKDNSWKIILLNNRGVSKEPLASKEHIFHEYDSKVTVTFPAGAVVKELYKKASLEKKGNAYSLTVPAGAVRILEARNIKSGSAPISDKALTRKGKSQKYQDLFPVREQTKAKQLKKQILAQWDFKEGSGNVTKDSVSGVAIKLSNAPFVKVKKGYALKFDGIKSYGTGVIRKPAGALDALSVELWCKPDISPGAPWTQRDGKRAGFVVHHGTLSFAMGVEGDQWQQLLSYDGYTTNAGLKIKNNQWAHLVFTWSGFTARFYVNGVEVIPRFGTFKLSGVSRGKDLRIFLGTHYWGPGSGYSRSFNGLIGELKYYNYALDEKEIRANLEKGKVKYSD